MNFSDLKRKLENSRMQEYFTNPSKKLINPFRNNRWNINLWSKESDKPADNSREDK